MRQTTAQADELRRHEAVLAAQADGQRWHEAAARAVESAALTLVEERHRHEAVLAAEEANEQRRHESAARAAESDAVFDRIRTEFALYAAPLNAILAEIACEEAAFKTKLSPCRPTSYVDAVLSNMGGAHNHLCPSLSRLRHSCLWLYHRLTSTANARRFVPVPDLAVALVDATSRERPVLPPQWLPPTLIYYRGGFLRRPPPRWREQPHLVAQWCRLHRLAGRRQILPPSNRRYPKYSRLTLLLIPSLV
jgi:hypothetical protein